MHWSRDSRCFVYVTDSQTLQKVVCGHACLTEQVYVPIVTRILDNIAEHLASGWPPPSFWHDPVVWLDRSHNKVADGLADLTMDEGHSWERRFATTLEVDKANIIIQTDGEVVPLQLGS